MRREAVLGKERRGDGTSALPAQLSENLKLLPNTFFFFLSNIHQVKGK
jgi:hypothetical protein